MCPLCTGCAPWSRGIAFLLWQLQSAVVRGYTCSRRPRPLVKDPERVASLPLRGCTEGFTDIQEEAQELNQLFANEEPVHRSELRLARWHAIHRASFALGVRRPGGFEDFEPGTARRPLPPMESKRASSTRGMRRFFWHCR